jgi:hypothetical protein
MRIEPRPVCIRVFRRNKKIAHLTLLVARTVFAVAKTIALLLLKDANLLKMTLSVTPKPNMKTVQAVALSVVGINLSPDLMVARRSIQTSTVLNWVLNTIQKWMLPGYIPVLK